MIGPGFSCVHVFCSCSWEPALGGPERDVLCQFDVFDVDVVLGDASA